MDVETIIRIALMVGFGIIILIYNIKHKDPLKIYKPKLNWKEDVIGGILSILLYIGGGGAILYPIYSVFRYAPYREKIIRIVFLSVSLVSFVILKIFFRNRFSNNKDGN